ncbi:MAG TPA: hypothetical protein PKX41_14010 [Anaerolineaceae bacterium]|jgi:RNA binding exosome subunit|nr:hypothetical protein [Anaerolineaceae bacterium]HPA34479.1 hypothetical protein [Anaerolineaceae bacterium]HQP62316.1 hypothetical protein [Anaerolineaceae bacterium]
MAEFFNKIWEKLMVVLTPGLMIPNWTELKGYMGDTMRIMSVSEEAIVVQAPLAKHLQRIPRDDFEKFWQIWEDYQSGRIPRGEITELTRYSKYIISILHWLETKTI